MPSLPDIPAADFTWDQSHVGSYDPVTASTFASLISNTTGGTGPGATTGEQTAEGLASTDVLGGIMEQKKWGPQGGAPMFNTPNCESRHCVDQRALTDTRSLASLVPDGRRAESYIALLRQCRRSHDGYSIRSQSDASYQPPFGSRLAKRLVAVQIQLFGRHANVSSGVNPSADALRVALLGIGAIHQAFLLARSGVSTAQTATMFQYASNLRDTGKEMVRRAAVDGTGARSDAALGASTALATIDIFFGGGNWMDNFKLAKEMIA